MSDDIENVINNIADDIATPDVENIHAIAASRKQQRKRASMLGGLAVFLGLVAGIGIWANQPEGTRLATLDEATADEGTSVGDDSAPVEVDLANDTILQRRLVNTPRWYVESREGIQQSANPGGERVSFAENHIALLNCHGIAYDITWEMSGFTVERPTPIDPTVPVPLVGCENSIDGIVQTPMSNGLNVRVEAAPNNQITLTSDEWQLTLTAIHPDDDESRIYVSLPLEEAAELAEANGLSWRVVHRDGQDVGIRLDFNGNRLNFTTQDGIVIHVRSDEELSTPDSPQVTTTTIVQTEGSQDESLCLDLMKEPNTRLDEFQDEKLRLCAQIAAQHSSTDQFISESIPSPQQQAALDGGLLESEYEEAFRRFQRCTTAAGVELEFTQTLKSDGVYGYRFIDAEGRLFIHDVCYSWHYELVDIEWQLAREALDSQPGAVSETECPGAALCATRFYLNGITYNVSCVAVSEDVIIDAVIGQGQAFGQAVAVHPIGGYLSTEIVAIDIPGGYCGDGDPAPFTTPWSFAFTDGANSRVLAAICEHGVLSPAQSEANGCS